MKLEKNHLDAIKRLCKVSKVRSLSAFGSVIRDDFTDESDVDLIVDFYENDPLRYSDLYFDLKDKLESLLRRRVDLLEERAIKNPFLRKELEHTKVKIYGH